MIFKKLIYRVFENLWSLFKVLLVHTNFGCGLLCLPPRPPRPPPRCPRKPPERCLKLESILRFVNCKYFSIVVFNNLSQNRHEDEVVSPFSKGVLSLNNKKEVSHSFLVNNFSYIKIYLMKDKVQQRSLTTFA